MSTMTTAASLLAKLRATAAPVQSAPARSNTKAPLSEPDVATVRAYIEQHEDAWLGVFVQCSLETGGRTADIASLRYENVDFETGKLTYTVAKQTKSAQARAYARGLKEIRESRMNACLVASDAAGFMRWSVATRDELAADASPAECDRLGYLVSSAPRKIDVKELSPDLLRRLAQMKKEAFWNDGFIFSRALTSSNRCRMESGHAITRSTMWARMKAVFAACAEQIETTVNQLSVYSLRKSHALAIYRLAGNSVAAVMASFGHSSESMSLKYLGMGTCAAKAQALLVGRGAV